MKKLNVTLATNLEKCRLEAEISDVSNRLVAVIYEDALGWHMEQEAGVRARVPYDFTENVKSEMRRYVNRTGVGAPKATTRGELSLWLMLKDDGTAMGIPYGSLDWVPVSEDDRKD